MTRTVLRGDGSVAALVARYRDDTTAPGDVSANRSLSAARQTDEAHRSHSADR